MRFIRYYSALRDLCFWFAHSASVVIFGLLVSFYKTTDPEVPQFLSAAHANYFYEIPDYTCMFQDESWDFHSNTEDDRGFIAFKESLAFKESGGRYQAVNTLGYRGKYQFGEEALMDCGVFDFDGFLEDSRLQEEVFAYYTFKNRSRLSKYIALYENKWVKGTLITESGMLAAAHLAGVGNVKKFLNTSGEFDSEDVYGSSISYYLRRFSGYQLGDYALQDTLSELDRQRQVEQNVPALALSSR